MKSSTANEIVKMISTCHVCGSSVMDDNDRFILCGETFERTCNACGWRITGKVENDEIIIIHDNSDKLKRGEAA